MRAVDVCIGCNDDFVVAELRDVEDVTDGGAECHDEVLHLLTPEHAVEARSLDVEDFSAERENRLRPAVTSHLCGAARGVSLHNEELRLLGRTALAVGELTREGHTLECSLSEYRVLRRLRRLPGLHRDDDLIDDLFRVLRVLLEERRKGIAEDRLDSPARLDRAELRLRLSLKLNLGHLYRNDCGDALENVVAREPCVLLLYREEVVLFRVVVECSRERRLEAGHVRAVLRVVNVVCKCGDARANVVDVLECDLNGEYLAVDVLLLGVEDGVVDRLLVLVVERDQGAEPSLEEEVHVRNLEVLVVEEVLARERLEKLRDVLRGHLLRLAQATFSAPRIHLVFVARTCVDDRDAEVLHEVRLLAEVCDDALPVVGDFFKDSRVGLERDDGTGELRGADLLYLCLRLPCLVLLDVIPAVAVHLGNHVGRERVYH